MGKNANNTYSLGAELDSFVGNSKQHLTQDIK